MARSKRRVRELSMARPYTNPYLAGTALGLVLLGCFVLTGQGLGASGAFAQGASTLADSAYFQSYRHSGSAWIVVQVLGVAAGGALSALAAGRFKLEVARGPRLAAASAGGLLMGAGAVLAGGCTSGQALSGGAMLSVGSWAFMLAVFAAGFAAMPLLRRLWP